ncbi:MAG TPA: GTP cyclohydrolase II [Gammaproteobacteria bacterium]|jgi:GTP cyclohydrolase II|nr:GTP cyclohydrolase II [Gammaproteobacteria bacterium]
MSSPDTHPINGNPAALAFDRAVDELRRGRAIKITDSGRGLLVAAVETLQSALLGRLLAASSGRSLLFVTAERALAAGLTRQLSGPVAVSVPPGADLERLRAVAGVNNAAAVDAAAYEVDTAPACAPLAAGALQIAKAGRLVPALLGFPTDGSDAAGVLGIPLADVTHLAPRFGHHALQMLSRARVPLADSLESEIAVFRDEHSLAEHVAVVIGKPDPTSAVPVRLHSACLTGDLLGSLRCDCGEQLRTAVARIAALGGGVLLYLDQEGRGIGLPNKLRAYVLQDGGLDTVDADQHLGFLADERTYDVAAALLHELGILRIRLLTNNPQKINSLRDHGIEVVGRLPLVTMSNTHNERYLRAKHERAGHLAEESSG